MKSYKTTIIFLLFSIIFISHEVFAGYVSPQADYIVWGFVHDEKGFPAVHKEVFLELSGGKFLYCLTNDEGLYKFCSFCEFSDKVNIVVERDGYKTIALKEIKMAYRQDFRYHIPKGFDNTTKSPIVYVTDYGTEYHLYGCQYLQKSCRPAPMDYCLFRGFGPCKICSPGLGK